MKKHVKYIILLMSLLAVSYLILSDNNKGKTPPFDIFGYSANTEEWETVPLSQMNDTRRLWLVNSDHGIPGDSELETVSAFHVIAIANSGISMDSKALDMLDRMFDDAGKQGYTDFFVSSGYRSYDEQKELYDESGDKSYVQTPGNSEHQTGLAVDIIYKGISANNMDERREGKWLADNAWKYGFILRYPKSKTDITGISFEPWHFRYVGLPHAYYCFVNEICYEEYIDYLSKDGGYSVTIDGILYNVYYSAPLDGKIKIPSNGTCEISGDNTGSYIITCTINE